MLIITTRDRIREVAKRWGQAYGKGQYGQDKMETLSKLSLLDLETVSAEKVDEIIGNKSWTSQRCDECDEYVHSVVRLGMEPDYDSNTAYVCFDCLSKAAALVGESDTA